MNEAKTFPDTALPDDVLAALAAEHPGTTVVTQPGASGFTILWLMSHYGGPLTVPADRRLCDPDLYHPLLSVREPGHGWPVPVVRHYSPDANIRQIDYDLCGPDHNPNRHRVGINDAKEAVGKVKDLAAARAAIEAHADECEAQQAHTPIDTPQKLYDLCKSLLDGSTPHSAGHTAAVKARAARHARRTAPKPASPADPPPP